jgi:hypothetical protein
MPQNKDIRVKVGDQIRVFPAGTQDSEIDTWVASIKATPKEVPFKEGAKPSSNTGSESTEKEELFPLNTAKGLVQRGRVPLAIGGSLAGAGLAAASGAGLPVTGLAASGGAGATDAIIDRYLYGKNKFPIGETVGAVEEGTQPFTSRILNTGAAAMENTLTNEALGRIIGVPLRMGKNAIREADRNAPGILQSTVAKARDAFGIKGGKGTITGSLSELDPTLSQYYGEKKPLIGTVENIFAHKSKERALENSATKVMQAVEDKSKLLTGSRVPISITDDLKKESLDSVSRKLQVKADVNATNLQDAIIDFDNELKKLTMANVPKTDPRYVDALTKRDQLAQEFVDNFRPPNESGSSVKDYLAATNTNTYTKYATPITDSIANDPLKMQRFFNGGQISIGGKTITSASPKKDLQGYQFMRMIQSSYNQDAGRINPAKLKQVWNTYKISDAGRKLYNQNTRQDLDALFEKIDKVSAVSGEKGASKYLTLRIGTGVAALGAGLVNGLIGGSTAGLATSGVIVGGAFTLHQMGKLMTNPNTARIMYAAASGGPLGVPESVAARVIGRAMRGEELTIEQKQEDGSIKNVRGKINAIGQWKPEE